MEEPVYRRKTAPAAPGLLIRVAATLATWLPSETGGQALASWGEAEWHAAEWLLYWQGSSAWMNERLKAGQIQAPAGIQARLEGAGSGLRERTRRMLDAAVEMIAAFNQEAIPALPLKGAVLAPLYYPDPFVRALGDLDLLVHPKDMRRAEETLRRLGYRFFKRTHKDAAYLRGERKDDVWAPDNVHPVEIQHRYVNEFAGLAYDQTEELWRGSRFQPYREGFSCLVPGPAATFGHVCAHASADWILGQGKLQQIQDVRLAAGRMSGLDWGSFAESLKPRTARFLYPAVAAGRRCAAFPIPAAVLSQMEELVPPRLRQWAAEMDLGEIFGLQAGDAIRREFDARLSRLFIQSTPDRVSALLQLAFPPRWHSRLEAYPRLAASPFWPAAYLLLNAKRVKKIIGRGTPS